MLFDFRILLLATCIVLFVNLVQLASGEPEEGAPVFFTRELVDPALLEGPHHRVRSIVEVEDFTYLFRVKSDFGDYEAQGHQELRECVREIEAIAHLKEVSQTEAFAASISKSVKDPIVMTVGVARRPVTTVTGLPSGIARYLEGKFYQVKKTSEKAIAFFRKKDQPQEVEVEVEESTPLAKRVGSSASSLGRKHLGYDDSKRQWARRLGVDPYTDNQALQEALGRIAWSSSIGEFAADFAVPSTEVVSYAGRADELVWSLSPHQLESANTKTLRRLGISKERIDAFTESPAYSLSEKAELVSFLESMEGAQGLEAAVDLALAAESKEDAMVMVKTLAILDLYSREVSPLSRVSITQGMLVGYGLNDYMILPLAVDYLHWNALISKSLASERLAVDRREIWISGEVSSIGAYRLRDLNWHVFEKCFEQGPRRYSIELSRAAQERAEEKANSSRM